jgi:hypothetical protein
MLGGVQPDAAGDRIQLRHSSGPPVRPGSRLGARTHRRPAASTRTDPGANTTLAGSPPQRVAAAQHEPARVRTAPSPVPTASRRFTPASAATNSERGWPSTSAVDPTARRAVVHHERARGEDQRVHRVVRDEHDRDRARIRASSSALLRGDEPPRLCGRGASSAANGSSSSRASGSAARRARSPPLLLPAGELRGRRACEAAEPHLLEAPVGAATGLGAGDALRAVRTRRSRAPTGGEQQRALPEQRDARRCGRHMHRARPGTRRLVQHASGDLDRAVQGRIPAIAFSSVDLPDPLGPITARISPGAPNAAESANAPRGPASTLIARPRSPAAHQHEHGDGDEDEQSERDRRVLLDAGAVERRVDRERHRAGDPGGVAGEQRGRAELAERAREAQHGAGDEPGAASGRVTRGTR